MVVAIPSRMSAPQRLRKPAWSRERGASTRVFVIVPPRREPEDTPSVLSTALVLRLAGVGGGRGPPPRDGAPPFPRLRARGPLRPRRGQRRRLHLLSLRAQPRRRRRPHLQPRRARRG